MVSVLLLFLLNPDVVISEQILLGCERNSLPQARERCLQTDRNISVHSHLSLQHPAILTLMSISMSVVMRRIFEEHPPSFGFHGYSRRLGK